MKGRKTGGAVKRAKPKTGGFKAAGAKRGGAQSAGSRGPAAKGPGAKGPGAKGPGAKGPGAKGPGFKSAGAKAGRDAAPKGGYKGRKTMEPVQETISEDVLYGRNPVLEALRKGTSINKIISAKGATGSLAQIKAQAREQGVRFEEADTSVLNKIAPGVNHQGVIAYVAPARYFELEEIMEQAADRAKSGLPADAPLLVILDGIEDPHNLGAIIRSVDGAGGSGVILPKRRSVPLTGAAAKASAGAVEHVPVSRVTNLSRTVEELKDQGYLVVGTDDEASLDFWSGEYKGAMALVIGGEGKGVSRLLKEKCDFLVRIPMAGRVSSLNASVAAALLLYEIQRQRGGDRGKGNTPG